MENEKDLVSVGPWRGVNNVADETSRVYAPGKQGAYLREAVNVDLSRDGWITRRSGRKQLLALTDGHSGVSIAGMLLLEDAGDIKRVRPGAGSADTIAEVLATGLSSREMSWAEAGGEVYWTNGIEVGRIKQGAATFWGLMPPSPPSLSAAGGNMPAGTYMVAVTCETADGTESGARQATQIVLGASGGITVANLTADPAAAYINLYVTECNGRELFWTERIDAASTSWTLVDLPVSGDPMDRLGMYGVPVGATLVRGFNGRLLVTVGNVLYWSQPLAYHLWRIATDFQMFAEPIVLLEPMDDGFYVAEGSRTWWVRGDDPETWSPMEVDDQRVAAGAAIRIPGRKIPALETHAMVAVWASESGPVAGLPGGVCVHLTEKVVAMDGNAKATLAYRERDGLAQILMGLRDKHATTGFTASDRVTATVIRG